MMCRADVHGVNSRKAAVSAITFIIDIAVAFLWDEEANYIMVKI